MLRYHGVFSPSSPMRKRLPAPPVRAPQAQHDHQADTEHGVTAFTEETDEQPASMSARIRWAQLIKRVYKKDLEQCPHCGGHRVLIAFITDPPVVQKLLSHLGLPTNLRSSPTSPQRARRPSSNSTRHGPTEPPSLPTLLPHPLNTQGPAHPPPTPQRTRSP
jgi:hypothetical protein